MNYPTTFSVSVLFGVIFVLTSVPVLRTSNLSGVWTADLDSYPRWQYLLDNVKIKYAEQTEAAQDDLDGFTTRYAYRVINCAYADRYLYLETLLRDLASVCKYAVLPSVVEPVSGQDPLTDCEALLIKTFGRTSTVFQLTEAALKYFIGSGNECKHDESIMHAVTNFKTACATFPATVDRLERSTMKGERIVRILLQTTVNKLQLLRDNLNEYVRDNCQFTATADYPGTSNGRRKDFENSPEQTTFVGYLDEKIDETYETIVKEDYIDCGLYFSEPVEQSASPNVES